MQQNRKIAIPNDDLTSKPGAGQFTNNKNRHTLYHSNTKACFSQLGY